MFYDTNTLKLKRLHKHLKYIYLDEGDTRDHCK